MKTSTLILWGKHFDEVMATTFTSILRQAGLATQVVGVHGRAASGAYGITIKADMTLGDAILMAQSVQVVVVPAHSPNIGTLANDPRLVKFLSEVYRYGATFICGKLSAEDTGLFPVPIHRIDSYRSPEAYIVAATALQNTLQQRTGSI